MGDEPLGDKQIVPGKNDLGHDVAIVAIVFEGVFIVAQTDLAAKCILPISGNEKNPGRLRASFSIPNLKQAWDWSTSDKITS